MHTYAYIHAYKSCTHKFHQFTTAWKEEKNKEKDKTRHGSDYDHSQPFQHRQKSASVLSMLAPISSFRASNRRSINAGIPDVCSDFCHFVQFCV